ncbi:MAG: hypothetical protein HY609_03515 [Deltaproteobacteria bacterium]|nr:hypothetical protein [Deltaproteobacteria bacterium]MBI4223978.1 hypothetical protein [Deltaproteobacteria bacterium]
MSGVINFPAVFNVWAQGADVYQNPLTVADAIDGAETIAVHHFDLLVDAYTDAFSERGAELGRLYQDHLKNVVDGNQAAAAFLKRQLAGQVRLTDQEKWLEMVRAADRRVQEGPVFLRTADRRFFLEGLRGRSVETRTPDPAGVAASTDIDQLRKLAETKGYLLALEGLDTQIRRGKRVAIAAGQAMDPRVIEESGLTPMSQWWLARMAEWGNVKAVWSLIHLKKKGDGHAEEMLGDIDPLNLARRAEADEEARRAVADLALFNRKAMRVLGDWILAGHLGYYALILYQTAKSDNATTRAIDELARVAAGKFEHLEWMFRLLNDFANEPGGDRYRATLTHLQSFDLSRLSGEAGRNLLAVYWLVQLGMIGHPHALERAEEVIEVIEEQLDTNKASVRWMLNQFPPGAIGSLRSQTDDLLARRLLRVLIK